ncbi:protein kinase [Streptomyces polyrhachis]|uniref:Protein kinase n=1 Tax=Streptomyces polyrhachis TaxID=1282885 RepID=A0ABW2GCK2_9ACTN
MQSLESEDPRVIGEYRLIGRLGAGGMGRVYLARSDLGRTVAVKLIHEQLAQEPLFRTRFRQEVTAARRVGGEWTAPVLDADTEAEVPWVATGYIAGPALEDIVDHDHGPLPEHSLRVLAAGLGRALQAIHAAGIIHRDLKPSNVLLTLDGPRVIDFGIARALHATGADAVTRPGMAVGSPAFMSPEQVRGEHLTPAGDVFSLGAVLVYAASGRMPFGTPEGGVMALMYRIANERPDLSGVPPQLHPLVASCLAKDPAARPTPEEIVALARAPRPGAGGEPWLPGGVLARLGRHAVRLLEVEAPQAGGSGESGRPDAQAASASSGTAGKAGGAAPADRRRARPRRRSRRLALVAAAVAAVALLGGGAVYLTADEVGDSGDPDTRTQGRHAVSAGADAGPSSSASPGGTKKPGAPATPPRGATGTPPPSGAPATTAPGGKAPAPGSPGASPAATPPPPPRPVDPGEVAPSFEPAAADVPAAFLGTWSGSSSALLASHSRRLSIVQGGIGQPVVTITGTGSGLLGATYTCVWTAPLAKAGSPGAPLTLGTATLTQADPASACSADPATTLTALSSSQLRREWPDGSKADMTFTRDS